MLLLINLFIILIERYIKKLLFKIRIMAIKCVNIVLDSCHVLDINLKLEIFGFLIPCWIKNMFLSMWHILPSWKILFQGVLCVTISSLNYISCMFLNPNNFSHLNLNCSNLSDMRNLREQVKKAFKFWTCLDKSELNFTLNSRYKIFIKRKLTLFIISSVHSKTASKIFGICGVMVPFSLLTVVAIVDRTSGSRAAGTVHLW